MSAVRYSFDLEKACEHINRFTKGDVVSVELLEGWAEEGLFEYEIKDGNYKISQEGIAAIEIYKNLIIDQQKTITQAKKEFNKALERKEKELEMKNYDLDITLDEESALIGLIKEMGNAQIINVIEVEETVRKEIEGLKDELVRMNQFYQQEIARRIKEKEKLEMELIYEKKYRKEAQEQLDELIEADFFKTLKLKYKYKKK